MSQATAWTDRGAWSARRRCTLISTSFPAAPTRDDQEALLEIAAGGEGLKFVAHEPGADVASDE